MTITETPRLLLREFAAADAAAIHALMTDADFLANIGHRGVDTLTDAARAIEERFRAGYRREGFGLWAVEGKAEGAVLGMAGLVRRAGLAHVDLGYALLPAARGRGYAREAARAVLDWAAAQGIAPVVAIVSPGNLTSIRVLEDLGLRAERLVRLPGAQHEVMLYAPGADPNGAPRMILAAILLQATSPACPAMDAALSKPLAGWTRAGTSLGEGRAATVKAAGGAAGASFEVTRAGVYGVALDQKGWIDVAPDGGAALTSVAHGHGPACSTIRKIVRYRLTPGRYRVTLTKLERPAAKLMLVSGEE